MRTFVLRDGATEKFWHIGLHGMTITVVSGQVGTRGQARDRHFFDAQQARAAFDKLVDAKTREGYVETATAPPATPTADQKALEAALVAHPDEIAAHSAYGDYLAEAGDPRGEFVQTQLALEDPKRSAAERTQLRKREKALQSLHERAWLGDLGRFLVGPWSGPDKPYHFAFARGWLDTVRILPVPEALIGAIARAPEARLLRRLEIVYDMRYHPFDFDQFTRGPQAAVVAGERGGAVYDGMPALPPLIGSTNLTNLRAFKIGFSDTGDRLAHSTMVDPFGTCTAKQVLALLAQCPRLEELYLNTGIEGVRVLFASPSIENLRVLQYYYGSDPYGENQANPYPLSALAKNKALTNLHTLRLHPGREAIIDLDEFDALLRSKNLPALAHLQVHMTNFGDEGADRVVASGILKRLKTLDIGYGNMTDAGARVLAACPDLKNLDALNVSQNALTKAGIRALRAAHAHVVADDQHAADDEGYLYEVDVE